MSSAGGCTKTSGRILSSESDFLEAMGLHLDENPVVLDEKVLARRERLFVSRKRFSFSNEKAG
jgi:hypothetical protein